MTKQDALMLAEKQAKNSFTNVVVWFTMHGEYVISGDQVKYGTVVKVFPAGRSMPPSNHDRFQDIR